MNPGNESPASFSGRPALPFPNSPQNLTPFTPGSVGTSGFSQTTSPHLSSVPFAGPQTSSNGPPNFSPSSTFSKQDPGIFHQTQVLRYPATGPHAFPPIVPPPVSLHPQTLNPSSPMGIPPHNANQAQYISRPQIQLEHSFSAPGPFMQTPLHGHSSIAPRGNIQPPPSNSQFLAPPVLQPPIRAFSPTNIPPVNPPFHTQYGAYVPPTAPPIGGTIQSMVEDFRSLSVAGSLDIGLDPNLLSRPFNTEDDPDSIPDSYPLNCHPRFFRLTTHAMPSSQSLFARWHLPLGAVVHPLAEAPDGEEVPVVNFGEAGVVRCRRCRTYVNPYVAFTDGGRKWRCNLCALLNDVPGEYFCPLDVNGRRCDVDQRPELSQGSVDFVAPKEYMLRPPMPPAYFFLIDVSISSIRTGLLEIIAKTIKSCLDELAGFPRTQIGFLTFDSALHFYNLKSYLTQPQMIVVTDLDDIFLPFPDDLVVNLFDSRNVVDAFLDSLPVMFQDNANVESALGPALKAALMVMNKLGGKLLVFQSTLSSLGVGRLRLRGDDLRMYGTDKEYTLRIAEDSFYKQMAAEFTQCQISVDIFAFGDHYSDIASLGSISKYTGGQVYHFPSFRAAIQQEKLIYELARDLTRETAWESVLRIRCGKGLRLTTYHGHFMHRSTDLLALPAVDCDKAIAMQLSLEETLVTTKTVYFQVALVYTSSSGERHIRVHTAAAPVVTDLSEMYRKADTGAIVSLFTRLEIENTMSTKLEDARQMIQLKLVKSLKEYRNLYSVQHRLGGRFIFPDSLKLLALYVLALNKSVALRGGYADSPLDERCAAGYRMSILPVKRMLKYLYPSLFRIDRDLIKGVDDFEESSKQLPLSAKSLDPSGMYILDDGFSFIIWFGGMLSSNIVNNVLGNDLSFSPDLSKISILYIITVSPQFLWPLLQRQIGPETSSLSSQAVADRRFSSEGSTATLGELDNDVSRKLMLILRRLKEKDPSSYQLCHMVRQGDQLREGHLLLSRLVEDQVAGTSSYIDWVLQIYRQSQSP